MAKYILKLNKSKYACMLCSQQFRLKSVCATHVERCMKPQKTDSSTEGNASKDQDDQYWNYKNGEFLLDSLFALTTVFEDYGDGLGMFLISKLLLPFFHGLKHSNYSCSIHRMITRVLSLSSPKEALKIIHERFFNREGRIGRNIFKGKAKFKSQCLLRHGDKNPFPALTLLDFQP